MLENNFEQQQPLSWLHSDIERRFGFRGEHYTRVNTFFAGLLAVLATILFYGTLRFIPEHHFTAMFTERGITPYPLVLFGFWTLFLLQIKKIILQASHFLYKYYQVRGGSPKAEPEGRSGGAGQKQCVGPGGRSTGQYIN